MRSNKEIAAQARRRSAILREKKQKMKRRIYAVSAVAVCLVLIVGLSFAIPTIVTDSSAVEAQGMHSAAILADAAAGGYILIGVVGFALGAAVTIFCVKGLNKKTPGEQPHDRND